MLVEPIRCEVELATKSVLTQSSILQLVNDPTDSTCMLVASGVWNSRYMLLLLLRGPYRWLSRLEPAAVEATLWRKASLQRPYKPPADEYINYLMNGNWETFYVACPENWTGRLPADVSCGAQSSICCLVEGEDGTRESCNNTWTITCSKLWPVADSLHQSHDAHCKLPQVYWHTLRFGSWFYSLLLSNCCYDTSRSHFHGKHTMTIFRVFLVNNPCRESNSGRPIRSQSLHEWYIMLYFHFGGCFKISVNSIKGTLLMIME